MSWPWPMVLVLVVTAGWLAAPRDPAHRAVMCISRAGGMPRPAHRQAAAAPGATIITGLISLVYCMAVVAVDCLWRNEVGCPPSTRQAGPGLAGR